MPKRTDINKILIIGSGPIQIGQGCEFDYSGTQACRALKDEGYTVILLNSNPATIMTDPDSADKVYLEPIDYPTVIRIIEKEKPDSILATVGGQVALNLLMQLHEKGDLEKYNLKPIGVNPRTVELTEDREEFKKLLGELGYNSPIGDFVHSEKEAIELLGNLKLEFPVIIRAAYTLGGTGGGIANNMEEYLEIVEKGLEASPIKELLVEECILGWKEYELEVMQDKVGNFLVVCAVENINPVGVHTGDSITIAPCMTLTDREYQELRNIAKHIFKSAGVESGGANIQYAIHPDTGKIIVIEINPRVSRSSALVSKATGYPIAQISALLAVGYNLDELKNEITGYTPAAFEPVIDYVAIKIPRWDFSKFPDSNPILGIQMKSVGEVLAFGRTFKDAFQKAWRSLENGMTGWSYSHLSKSELDDSSKVINENHFLFIKYALKKGMTVDEIYEKTKISKWFLQQLKEIVEIENDIRENLFENTSLQEAKKLGFSNQQLAQFTSKSTEEVSRLLQQNNIKPTFKMVDTCAGEFEAKTPYFFKTYEQKDDNRFSEKKKVIIIGSGPNRIGQGIEFDYSCVHAVKAFQELGYESIMVNCNPETVSTDYHTADKLYIEPLTNEDLIDIIKAENPEGVVIQFGGQTPLKLAKSIEENGTKILGTNFSNIELSENREEFGKILKELNIIAPPFHTVLTEDEAIKAGQDLGYPVLVRPSYVLGGRGMKIVYNEDDLKLYIRNAVKISPEHPILIDKYLENAEEFDLDALSDGNDVFIAGIMQHIENAGVHSGDSSCVLPPFSITEEQNQEMRSIANNLAKRMKIIGIFNIQFAVYQNKVYIIELNPRCSRTVPFLAKSTGLKLANYAAKLSTGLSLKDLNLKEPELSMVNVKIPVFPFQKFDNINPYLGPEMRSIGEVMGRDKTLGTAYAKAMIASGNKLPDAGGVLITVNDKDKKRIIPIARDIVSLGFTIYSTAGTQKLLKLNGIESKLVHRHSSDLSKDRTSDIIKDAKINFIINTPLDEQSRKDEQIIGQLAIKQAIPFISTISGAYAFVRALFNLKMKNYEIHDLNAN